MSAYEPFARALAGALEPLAGALSSPREARRLLAELGWTVPMDAEVLARFEAILPLAESLARLPELIAALEDEDERAAAIEGLVELLAEVAAAVEGLHELDAEQLAELPGALADPQMWADLGRALLDLLLVRWLEDEAPVLVTLLRLTGLCVDEPAGRRTRPRLRWTELATVASDPGAAIAETLGWGGPRFRAWWLQQQIAELFASLGLRVRMQPRRLATAQVLAGGEVELEAPAGIDTDLILFSGTLGQHRVELGLVLAATAEAGGAVALGNLAYGELEDGLAIAEGWSLSLRGEFDGAATIAARLSPEGLSLTGGDAAIDVTLALEGQPDEPWVLIGSREGPRLELDGLGLGFGVAGAVADPELWAAAEIPEAGARLVLDLGDDAFLSELIGEAPSLNLDFGLRWSSKAGFTLSGGVGFEVEIPVDRQVGPLDLQAFGIALRAGSEGLRAEATVTGSVTLGPFSAAADRVGLALELAPSDGAEGFAGLDAALVFVPPTGFGLSLDAGGVITGGGYLELDHDAGRYAGVAELQLLEIGVTAIGVLNTKLPDGAKGWSLFLCIAAEFPGLQLGFGFTLTGVGGLIGVNRGVDLEALGEGVRAGSLDTILFPEDPVADAPRILEEIETIFPVRKGQYVFGPVVKIGWGTPTLFTAEIGLIVQLPEPLTISLIGSFEALLPDAKLPLVELRLDVAGSLDFSAGTLAVDASLRDSRVAGLTLSGDMALRAAFGDEPSFLVAFGGFNPHFTPPAAFPKLERLRVALDTGDNLRIGLSGYFALSSNTVQFGAAAELWAKAIGLTVEGNFEFDALIQFTPFCFIVDLGFCVEVRAGKVELFGVALDLQLEGPKPWYVLGAAQFKVLGVKKSFRVEASIGAAAKQGPPETVALRERLLAALRDPASWAEAGLSRDDQVVMLSEPAAGDARARVHPAGAVELRQRVAPFERRLDHFGSAKLVGGDRFALEDPRVAEQPAAGATVEDHFAPAQFFRMDDEDKISAPSFEKMPAGLRIGDAGVEAGPARAFELDYEQVIRDPEAAGANGDQAERRLRGRAALGADELALADGLRRSITDAGPVRRSASAFALEQPRFVVGDAETGRRAAGPKRGSSWSAARERLLAGPQLGRRQIVPRWELDGAGGDDDEEDAA